MRRRWLLCLGLSLWGCASAAPATQPARPAPHRTADDAEQARAIGELLDGWHRAAAQADEEAYFSCFTPDAVFLGTDATERWDVEAFRAYAHPHFAKGKAWSFAAVRRALVISRDGAVAWFDEDLAAPNLGPARGSGVVLQQEDGSWKIAHYNLAITVPNERFDEVKALLQRAQPTTGQPTTGEPE